MDFLALRGKTSFVIGNAAVVGENGEFFADGAVLVCGGKIAYIGETSEIKKNADADFFDAGGRLLLAGLVNAHHHLYSHFAPGITPRGASATFAQILDNLWWALDAALDEESVYYSALMGALDSVAHGATTLFDHHASMNFVSGSLDVVKKALADVGIRGVLCFETSDRGDMHAHIRENVNFYERNKNDALFKGMFGLHANMTLSDETLAAIKNEIPPEMPVHVHCGESFEDFAFCVNKGYSGAVDRLYKFGLVSERSILAHCVHVSARDVEIIREIKPFVVTNAESNANNCVGKFDRALLPRHVIGTDGMSGDMVGALRSYLLLGGGGREPFDRMAGAFFDTRRELLKGYFPQCKGIAIDSAADIAVLDYRPLAPIDSHNVLGHLLFGAKGGKAWMTVIDGKILWHEGKFHDGIDILDIQEKSKQAARKLHERFYGCSRS